MKLVRCLAAAAAVLLAFANTPAAVVAPLPYHDVAATPISCPVPWASPLAGGPLRVLAIAPYGAMGDIAALRAHIDLNLDAVALWDRDHVGFDPLYPEPDFPDAAQEAVEKRLGRLLEKQRYDVILLGQCAPDALSEAIQQRIIEHVEKGAGLLVTGLPPASRGPLVTWLTAQAAAPLPNLLVRGLGPMGIPEADARALVSCRDSSAGRIVLLEFKNAPSPNHCLVPLPDNPYDMLEEYETNALGLACKALLWAAGREPRIAIRDLVDVSPQGPNDEEIPPGYPPEFIEAVRRNAFNQPIRPYILNLEQPAEDDYEVVYQIRLPGVSLPAMLVNPGNLLPKGAAYYPLDIIAAPGTYVADIWLKNRRGVVTWHTETITVRGWPQLGNFTITQEGRKAVWLKPNDHLDIALNVEPMALLTSGQDATVFVRAIDSFGRQVASASRVVGAEGGPLAFRLDLADLFAPLLKVEIYGIPSALVSESSLVGQAAREVFYFPVRLPDPALAPAVILSTGGPFDYSTYRQIRHLAEQTGATALHAPLDAASLLASSKAGLSRIARLGSLDAGRVGLGAIRIPCLSDPEAQNRENAAISTGVLQAWAGGPPIYSLGAGCALTAGDVNVCQSTHCLARFQQRLRGRYPDLDTLNQTWRESFSSWEEVVPTPLDQAQQHDLWPAWLEFRRAMDQVFADTIQRGRDAVRATDPSGRVGFEARHEDITPVTGYDWNLLARAADYLAVPAEPDAVRRLQYFHGPRAQGGVVLGFDTLRGRPEWARWAAWNSLFHQLPALWLEQPFGNGPRSLVSPLGAPEPGLAALAGAAALIQEGIGQLVLNAAPQTTGIAMLDSPATRYLDQAQPGITHGNGTSESWLTDTINRLGFRPGIVNLESGDGRGLDGVNTLILPRVRALSDGEIAALKSFHENSGLIIADGQPGALDGNGAPRTGVALPYLHAMTRDSGANADLWTNRPVWVNQIAGEATGSVAMLGHMLARAGNTPAPPVQLPEKIAGSMTRFQFHYGAATILAFLPAPGMAKVSRPASFRLPKDHYGFDLLQPLESVARGRVQWYTSPDRPAIFSILPYPIEEMRVEAPEIAAPGQRVTVRAMLISGGAPPGTHLMQLRLTGPDGRELRHYRQTIVAPDGMIDTFIPLAENEMKGRYDLEIVDVLTRYGVLLDLEIAG